MAEPRFVRLYPGPTLQWGGPTVVPPGVELSSRYCTTNLYGLTNDGRVFALTFDYLAPKELPTWMRIGGDVG